MKKIHWLRNTLIILVICGLIGTVIAAIRFSKDAGRTSASARIEFSFNGAAEGKAPNGYPFDISGMISDEVLNAALAASGLTDKYTADQIRESMTVTGIYPDKIVDRLTKYVSLLQKDADNQAAMVDYYATEYSVTLYNDFDPKVPSGTMTELLGSILSAYRAYFAKTYGTNLMAGSPISDLTEYDYAQQLDAISENAEQSGRYAQEMSGMAPGFRLEGKSFGDIAARYNSVKSDIDLLNASVSLNSISKDLDRLQKQYETEIRTQQHELESLTDELKQIEEQVKTYEKNCLIYFYNYNNTNNESILYQIGNDKTGTYDRLVRKHKEVTDQIAKVKERITLYQDRMKDINETVDASAEGAVSSGTKTQAEIKALRVSTEKKLEELTTKVNAVTTDYTAMLKAYSEQQINDETVSMTTVKYHTPSIFSSSFIMLALKTAGPFCAVGFMACLVLLIRSRKKEEKTNV